MVNYYDLDIIPIILNRFKVNNVIISGLSNKKTINQILTYCNANNAAYTLIDSQINENENIIHDFTLNVLPNLTDFDAIFLNDDPNWYTVFNELNIIKSNNQEFPLVFICHNIFPHKRKDSYINPKIIPKEFLNEYSDELNYENISINDGFFHAIEENTPKNGVLTAIEDFIKVNPSIDIMNINFLNGLTILYYKDSISHIRLGKLVEEIKDYELKEDNLSDSIVENQILTNHINQINIDNSNLDNIDELKSEMNKKEKIINDYENQVKLHDDELNLITSQMDNLDSELDLKETQLKNAESKLINRDQRINDINNELENVNNKLNSLKSTLQQKEKRETELNNQLQNANNQINEQNEELIDKNNQIQNKEHEINKTEQKLNSIQKRYTNQLSKLDTKEYCISCYQNEINNNQLEIEYLKKENLIKKILSPIAYIYILLKSNPHELSLNIKLYKALKNSKCFDIGFYLNENKDLQNSKWCKYFSPELHYVCNGFNEHRKFNKKYFNRNSKKELLSYILNCNY